MTTTTLLITVTAFDDRSRLAYSLVTTIAGGVPHFSSIHQCEASAETWGYLLHWLPDSLYDAIRLCVIDRRPGTRATSRSAGRSLTAAQEVR